MEGGGGGMDFAKWVHEREISHQRFIIGDLHDFDCFDATLGKRIRARGRGKGRKIAAPVQYRFSR